MHFPNHGLARADGKALAPRLIRETLHIRGTRQRQAQEAGDAVVGQDPLQKAFVRVARLVPDDIEDQVAQIDVVRSDLSKSNLLDAVRTAHVAQAPLDELAQIGLLVARHDIVRREIPDHAGDTAERRRDGDIARQHVEQFPLGVGAP